MTIAHPFADSRTVEVWKKSAGIDGGDPRIETLGAFCTAVAATPDELIDACLRAVAGGQFKIRMAARRHLSEQIDAFQEGDQARGNVVRSFLIHNGVSLQPPTILR